MDIEIRELAIEELADIPKLDVTAEEGIYALEPAHTDGRLTLKKKRDEPLREFPAWGVNEISSRLELWRKNYAEGCKFFGAFSQDQLVGFCLLSSESMDDALELYSIFVDRGSRGKGIGRKLVIVAERHCKQRGVKGIYTKTTLDGTAVDFYLKVGFSIVGLHTRCYKHEGGEVAFFKQV